MIEVHELTSLDELISEAKGAIRVGCTTDPTDRCNWFERHNYVGTFYFASTEDMASAEQKVLAANEDATQPAAEAKPGFAFVIKGTKFVPSLTSFKKDDCSFWARDPEARWCPRGVFCWFRHGDESLEDKRVAWKHAFPSETRDHWKETPCKFGGSCRYAIAGKPDFCPYDHEQEASTDVADTAIREERCPQDNGFDQPITAAEFERQGRTDILILYTGGTFGMKIGPDGTLIPTTEDEFLGLVKEKVPSLHQELQANCVFRAITPIDSALASPKDWYAIAKEVDEAHRERKKDGSSPHQMRFRGVVVIHGTDTLPYTAAALHYALPNISIPVVVMGSQLTVFAPNTDGLTNILGSIKVARWKDECLWAPGVSAFFNRRLMSGPALMKLDSLNFDAFNTPKEPLLAIETVEGIVFNAHRRQRLVSRLVRRFVSLIPEPQSNIAMIPMFPGITPAFVANGLRDVQAALLIAYGAGNSPAVRVKGCPNALLTALIDAATKKPKTAMAVTTDCVKGSILTGEGSYAASLYNSLYDAGAEPIDCRSLTVPTSLAKLTVCADNCDIRRNWEAWRHLDLVSSDAAIGDS